MTSMRQTFRQTTWAIAFACLGSAALAQSVAPASKKAAPVTVAAERSMLRITCEGPSANAEVTINGDFKGECPLDVPVPAGTVELRAVRKVSATHERVYERTFRVGAGIGKREEIELGEPQLNADGMRLLAEQQKRRDALAAERVAEQRRAEADADRAFAALLARAEGGEVPAMSQLAAQIDAGRGADATPQRASGWYLKAATAGDPQAMFRTARRLENGFGVPKDLKAASAWYRKAAEAGHMGGVGGLAAFAYNGWGDFASRDFVQSRAFAEKAAAGGDPRGMHVLGVLHMTGQGGLPRDPPAVPSTAQTLTAALAGSAPAPGVAPSTQWLERAAAGGERRSIAVLADRLYRRSERNSPDEVRAIAMARAASESGDDGAPPVAAALFVLGQAQQFGAAGFAKDPARALPWYQKAADLDSADAMFALGMFQWRGEAGLQKNEAAAFQQFLQAGLQNHGDAMNNLGWFYQYGLGGQPVNKGVAATWYRRADEAGVPNAKANLKTLGWLH